VSRLSRRLASVEGRVAVKHSEAPGVIEIHLTRAWPACADHGYEPCGDHAPTCGVSVRPFKTPGLQVIIRGVPWLGV
jgi:hypothetical protein